MKPLTLCNCLWFFFPSSSPFRRFSTSCVWDFKIINWYFRIWKFLNMGDRCGEFDFFQFHHVRTDIRIDISVSIRPMTTKFGKVVDLGKLPQVRLIQQTWCYAWWRHHVKMTWKKPVIFPLPQCLWLPNLAGWWIALSGFYTQYYSALYSRGLARSRDKLKTFYLYYQSTYGHENWHDGD